MNCENCKFELVCFDEIDYEDCSELMNDNGYDIEEFYDEDDDTWEEMSYAITFDRWESECTEDAFENENLQEYVSKVKLNNVYGGDYREYEEFLFTELNLDEFGELEFDEEDVEEFEWE